jgi:outer membrane receptor for ferrienterochelin and colicin
MKSFQIFCGMLFMCVILSCNISNTASSSSRKSDFDKQADVENPEHAISLVDHLRGLPGVQVSGSGSSARITIRGINSFTLQSEPLFVLNGQPLAGGLSAAIAVAPVESIKSIRVLKNAEDIGFYGVRGANGIIEITLKTTEY